MATARINTGSDATWARAWEVDDAAGRIALLATYTDPFGPKRGDMIVQLDTTTIYLVIGANLAKAISPVDVVDGGTGLITIAQGDILYGSATDVISRLAKSATATRYLSNQGGSNNPSWSQVDLTNGVTGVLPFVNGGTGAWADEAFDAGNFTANGTMTWTVASGDVVSNRYILVSEKTLIWAMTLTTTTIGGSVNTTLRATLPGGFTAAAEVNMRCPYLNNGGFVDAFITARAGQAYLEIRRTDLGNFALGTNDVEVYLYVPGLEIQ